MSIRRSFTEDYLTYDRSDDNRPAWDYDYSCLFAYDASEDGTLLNVWNSLDNEVKAGFWEGANLYVMILRGKDTERKTKIGLTALPNLY